VLNELVVEATLSGGDKKGAADGEADWDGCCQRFVL